MNKYGWNKKLGSKRSQGIITPKAPRLQKCKCWFRGDSLYEKNRWCLTHNMDEVLEGLREQAKMLQGINQEPEIKNG